MTKAIVLAIHFILIPGMSCLQAQKSVSEKGMKYVIEDSGRGLKIEYNGKIKLSPDDRSIIAISDGGFFRIEKTTFGNSRELLIASRGSSLSYEYKESGRIIPFEPEGKAWFSDILPELVKTTPIASEHRVERLLKKGGVKAVMEALPELKDENVRTAFISSLLEKDIKEGDITRIIQTVGNVISSDHYRYNIFSQIFPTHSKSLANLLEAVGMLSSEHYIYNLIKPVVNSLILAEQHQEAFQLISIVKSDHYKADILKEVCDSNPGEKVKIKIRETAKSIKSSVFYGEVMKCLD